MFKNRIIGGKYFPSILFLKINKWVRKEVRDIF